MMRVREEAVEEPNPRAATDWDAATLGFIIYHFEFDDGRALRGRWPLDRQPKYVVMHDARGADAPSGWFYDWPEAGAVVEELRRLGFSEIRILERNAESYFDPTRLKAGQ